MKNLLQLSVKFFILFFAISTYGQTFVDVTKSNDGQSITLSTDQVLQVKLPRNPSTGYLWVVSKSSEDKTAQQTIAEIGDGDFEPDAASGTLTGKQLVGKAGTQIIRYAGMLAGSTEIQLELRRPWEKDIPALDNFTITVISAGKYTGNYVPPVKAKLNHVTTTSKTVPSHWDWRPQCTPVADQMYCGDCWAFAGVGTLECNINIIDGVTRDISEKFVTDCYTDNGCSGCNGGWCPHEAWLASYYGANSQGGGAVYESQDPWTTNEGNGYTGTCGGPYTPHETIDSYADVAGQDGDGVPPDANLKDAIYNYGPIWIALDASSNNWSNYSGGILTEVSPAGQVDHAVCLVGWVDSAAISGGGYWILRNSWGTGWGLNGTGYMYISYGSDLVGAYADYIVYHGGVPHAVPPVADFAASTTSSCTGTIQFNDASGNNPTSWLWNFGDGGTSTIENPSHTYTSNGTYSVTLTATNAYGYNSITKSSYVSINMPAAPTTTGASCTGPPCSVTLSATGSGTLNWYTANIGGTLINTGTSYTTPALSSTTTYYVERNVTQPVQSAGLAAKSNSGGYYTSTGTWALVFDALNPFRINSVTVYASGSANRTIWLQNSSGTVLNTITVNIPNGQQSVTLNFDVPAGTGYMLGTDAANNLWRDNAGAVYPYTVSNLLSITGNTAGSTATAYYYYFYNWQVQAPICTSPRVPVIATVNSTTGLIENSSSDFGIFPNPVTDNLTIETPSHCTIQILSIQGQLMKTLAAGSTKTNIDVSALPAGMYIVQVKTEKGIAVKKFVKE